MGQRGGWHVDHLTDTTALPVRAVNRALTELQFADLIRQDHCFLWEPAGNSLFGIALEDSEPTRDLSMSTDAPRGASEVSQPKHEHGATPPV